MSKRAYISRYLLILKKLRSKPYSSLEEIASYMERQFETLQMQDETLELAFSERTWARDKKEISNLFGISIDYSRQNKGYYISGTESERMNFQRVIEAFDIFNSLHIAEDISPFLYLDKPKNQGTENLYGLLHAIKNKLQIQFVYVKFWDEYATTTRTAEPYALKEFKNRWYVIAKNKLDNCTKSFALDRLTDLQITNQSFLLPPDNNIAATYRYCYGIVGPNADKPEHVILSFNAEQGRYIKSMPLHATQKILIDNNNELRIALQLYITHDFVMELLSLGSNVKVLQPKSLAEQLKNELFNAYKQY